MEYFLTTTFHNLFIPSCHSFEFNVYPQINIVCTQYHDNTIEKWVEIRNYFVLINL